MYIRATVTGPSGSVRISNGNVQIKDPTPPVINITTPRVSQNITKKWFYVNWTTSETASCNLYLYNYQQFRSSYCNNWGNSSSSMLIKSCNVTKHKFNGSRYSSEYVSSNYRSWTLNNTYGWKSDSTGLSTGGTSHYYQFNVSEYLKQSYALHVTCNDEDWNMGSAYTAFRINFTG